MLRSLRARRLGGERGGKHRRSRRSVGESVPWESERDGSPRNGSASDSATVHRKTSENPRTRDGNDAVYVPNIDEHTVDSLAESEAETIDSVLLLVGTGPHSELAAEAARAIAKAADAPVTVLHVVDPDGAGEKRADADDLLKFAEYVLGPDVTVNTELQEAPEATEVILEKAQAHDLTTIGAPEQQSRLEEVVFEPVQETLTQRSGVTVLMARDSDRTIRSLYYRWKPGMDAIEDGDEVD
ncbi:universal stress protein (plasmid) [Halobacterium sp. GSL-19]|nr:universal stress protein [Halobacterium sp. GSL-19]